MSWTDKMTDMKGQLRALNQAAPGMSKAFGALDKAAGDGTALSRKTKELIALSIAVADRCEPCIMFHAKSLIRHGGTREELAEALGVCVQMGGGPSMMYAAKALACYDELSPAPMATA